MNIKYNSKERGYETKAVRREENRKIKNKNNKNK